jgi:hypothetical protein
MPLINRHSDLRKNWEGHLGIGPKIDARNVLDEGGACACHHLIQVVLFSSWSVVEREASISTSQSKLPIRSDFVLLQKTPTKN